MSRIHVIDADGSDYEVNETPDYPLDEDGNPCKMVKRPAAHRIDVAEFVPAEDRSRMMNDALGYGGPSSGGERWRLVPVGRISATACGLAVAYVLDLVALFPFAA